MSKQDEPKGTVNFINQPNLELMARALINLYNQTGGKTVKEINKELRK
ncbi:hypothetical protein [Bacillus infantis]